MCPTCHIGLDLAEVAPPAAPDVVVFETRDRPSADIVAGLLAAHGLPCAIRGTDDRLHVGLWGAGYWRVLVPASEEASAQEILDAEIGRERED